MRQRSPETALAATSCPATVYRAIDLSALIGTLRETLAAMATLRVAGGWAKAKPQSAISGPRCARPSHPSARIAQGSDQGSASVCPVFLAAARRRGKRADRRLLSIITGSQQGGTPDYYGGVVSNWANSPQPTVNVATGVITGGIQKFVDSAAGLYVADANPVQDAANLAAASEQPRAVHSRRHPG